MMTLDTRALGEDDVDAMAAMAASCFERPWSPAVLRDEIVRTGRDYLGTFAGGTLVGFGGTADLAGELHVMTVAVEPSHRRAGIGRALVTELLARAGVRGIAQATLEVRAEDIGARALYQSLGFREVGQRPAYYGDDAAVIMTRSGL
jgi:ribosomal-protein-alanine N-acetyltransferase